MSVSCQSARDSGREGYRVGRECEVHHSINHCPLHNIQNSRIIIVSHRTRSLLHCIIVPDAQYGTTQCYCWIWHNDDRFPAVGQKIQEILPSHKDAEPTHRGSTGSLRPGVLRWAPLVPIQPQIEARHLRGHEEHVLRVRLSAGGRAGKNAGRPHTARSHIGQQQWGRLGQRRRPHGYGVKSESNSLLLPIYTFVNCYPCWICARPHAYYIHPEKWIKKNTQNIMLSTFNHILQWFNHAQICWE